MNGSTFQLIVMEDARRFLKSLPFPVRKKIAYNIDKVQGGYKDVELFKKLENSNIWEFRTLFDGIQYRLFAFWDTEEKAFVIATHGIIKKTQKTPAKEIAKAEGLRIQYFETKRKAK